MTAQIWWFASRASGLVLWLLLAASVGWGLAVAARLVRRKGLPAWMLDLHKHLGTLSIAFTAAHLFALWADSYTTFGWRELFVPMASEWKPGPVTWGIVAFYLLVIVQATSLVMKKLPRKVWHTIHLLSLPLFVAGTVHGILAGTDWSNPAVRWATILVTSAVIWFATFRLAKPERSPAGGDRMAAVKAARDAQARSASASVGEVLRPPTPGTATTFATPETLKVPAQAATRTTEFWNGEARNSTN